MPMLPSLQRGPQAFFIGLAEAAAHLHAVSHVHGVRVDAPMHEINTGWPGDGVDRRGRDDGGSTKRSEEHQARGSRCCEAAL